MIKLFLLLLITTVNSYGQQQKDTLCLPTENVRALVIAAEQGKVLKQQVVVLGERITLLQSMVANLEAKDSATVAAYEAQIKNMTDTRAIFEDQIKTYEKLLRREKRKRFFATAGGIITSGIILYLTNK